jgi:hypothetical protein
MSWIETAQGWLKDKPRRADWAAVLFLSIIWLFYFWRAITGDPLHQVSYPEGDFSGQFVAFSAYQADRLVDGEIPLWNPYNYAGHPFIADTQAAVFYPPRLIAIWISQFTGGWGYAAVQAEAIAHFWLVSIWMYLFVRTVTKSPLGGLISAITLSYGGYLTGYPPLQLALLEAGTWLPLCLLGIYRATEDQAGRLTIGWLGLSAGALGMSLLAGHPQTSWFITYLLVAYIIHRAARKGLKWWLAPIMMAVVFGLGYGLDGVQLLPGLEYLGRTVRAELGFDALAKGFPLRDLIVFVIPNVVTVWSPLYSGIAALALAGIAIWRKHESARFWGVTVLLAIIYSFGGATILYRLAYLLLPGCSLFHGQERAAFVIAYGIAFLAGMGVSTLQKEQFDLKIVRRILAICTIIAAAAALESFILSRFFTEIDTSRTSIITGAIFLTLLLAAAWAVIGQWGNQAQKGWWAAAITALVVFDVVSLTWYTNWEAFPAGERELIVHDLVDPVLEDHSLFRVDGRLGLAGNYGSMFGIQDIRGISPLRLQALENYQTMLPAYRQYQLLGVKYVFTDWDQLEVPGTIIAEKQTLGYPTTWKVHRLEPDYPRAWMTYQILEVADDPAALGWLNEPALDPFATVILNETPALDLPETAPTDWSVTITEYEPERIAMEVETPEDGVLVVSEWDYPGWQASIDGEKVETLRAFAGIRALAVEAGDHVITFEYRPVSVRLGAVISGVCLVIIVGIVAGSKRLSAIIDF